ncbi:MAG: class 3 adenylate cyclase, partial [Gammaproteobacteria bacterium]
MANIASRFCDTARNGQILIGETVHAETAELVEVVSTGEHLLKGFQDPITIYQVVGISRSECSTDGR